MEDHDACPRQRPGCPPRACAYTFRVDDGFEQLKTFVLDADGGHAPLLEATSYGPEATHVFAVAAYFARGGAADDTRSSRRAARLRHAAADENYHVPLLVSLVVLTYRALSAHRRSDGRLQARMAQPRPALGQVVPHRRIGARSTSRPDSSLDRAGRREGTRQGTAARSGGARGGF